MIVHMVLENNVFLEYFPFLSTKSVLLFFPGELTGNMVHHAWENFAPSAFMVTFGGFIDSGLFQHLLMDSA